MRRYVGVDPSLTATGIAILDMNGADISLRAFHVSPPAKAKLTGVRRIAWFRSYFEGLWKDLSPVKLVALEGYSFDSRNSRAHALGELGGVVRLSMLELRDASIIEVAPASLKAFVCGRGNVVKSFVPEGVRQTCHQFFGRDLSALSGVETHDEFDATGLALMAWAFDVARWEPALSSLTPPQRRALAAADTIIGDIPDFPPRPYKNRPLESWERTHKPRSAKARREASKRATQRAAEKAAQKAAEKAALESAPQGQALAKKSGT